MFRNILKSLFMTFMCVFAMSCTFIGENTGSIQFALPEASSLIPVRSSREYNNESDVKLTIEVKSQSGKIFSQKEYELNNDKVTKVSINNIPVGKYTVRTYGETEKYKYNSDIKEVEIYGGIVTKTSLTLKVARKETIKPENPDPGTNPTPQPETPEPNPTPKEFDLTVNLTGNVGVSSLSYTVTPGDKKGNITGNRFTVAGLNADIEYTVTVTGSSDTDNYNGTVSTKISAIEKNEINIDLRKTVRKFDVTGTISGVPEDAKIKVIVQENGKGDPIAANVVTYNSYKFTQLPAGIYNISVNGGSNGFVYSGEIKNVTVDANNTNITTPIVCTSSNKIAAIAGKVKLPSVTKELTLTAYANNAISKGNVKGESAVSLTDGTFRIENLNIGTYSVTVKGESATHLYEGSLSSPVELVEGVNNLPDEILLQEILKTGGLKINWPSNVPETVSLRFDIKQGSSSLAGYPKTVTKTDFQSSIKDLTAGIYKLSLTGSDDLYDYKSSPCEVTVEVGNNEKPVTIEITKSNILRNLVVTLKNNSTIKNIKYTLTSSGTNEKTGQVSDNNLTIKDLIVGNTYSLKITGNNDTHEYAGSKNIKITKTGNNELLFDFKTSDFTKTQKKSSLTVNLKEITGGQSLDISNSKLYYTISGSTEKKNISNNTFTINDLNVGESYIIKISGETNDKKYTFAATSENIKITENINTLNINVKKTEVAIPDPSEIIPDPTNGIFCVNENGVDNYNKHNGKEAFKTVSYAIKNITNQTQKDNCKIYVKGNTIESSTLDGGSGYPVSRNFTIISADKNLVTIDAKYPFTLTGNSAVLTLDKNITIKNSGASKVAVSVGYQSVLNINQDTNISPDSFITVLSDGKINFTKDYSGTGKINVNMKGTDGSEVGGAAGKTIITTEGILIADAVSKINFVSDKYILNSNGQLEEKQKPSEPTNAYYVGGTGANDKTNNGAESAPFATVAKAMEAIQIRNPLPTEAVTIYVDGTITESSKFVLDHALNITITNKPGSTASITNNTTQFGQVANTSACLSISNCSITNNWNNGIVVTKGKLVLDDGVTINNNKECALNINLTGQLSMGGSAKVVGNIQLTSDGNNFPCINVVKKLTENAGTIKLVDTAYYGTTHSVITAVSGVDLAAAVEQFNFTDTAYYIGTEGKLIKGSKPSPEASTIVQDFASFKSALAKGGNIKITKDFAITETLNVSNNVTISNDSAVTLTRDNAAAKLPLFKVAKKGNLTIKGSSSTAKITLDGGSIDGIDNAGGTLITSLGTLNIDNCILQNNNNFENITAKPQPAQNTAGAIYIQNGKKTTISNTTITGCSSHNNKFGGVITVCNSNVTISNCDISGNKDITAGAVHCYGQGTTTIIDSVIKGNETGLNSSDPIVAGLHVREGATVVLDQKTTGTQITNNISKGTVASGVYLNVGHLEIKGDKSYIDDNTMEGNKKVNLYVETNKGSTLNGPTIGYTDIPQGNRIDMTSKGLGLL